MKYALLLGSLFGAITASSAQNLLGISTTSRGGTNRLYLNPALAADSPNRIYLNVATVGAHLDNNYVRYQAPFSLVRLVSRTAPDQYRRPDGSIQFAVDYTDENLDGQPKNGTIWGEVRGPALQVRLGERSAVAVTSRLRAIGQVVGASEQLVSAVRAGLTEGILFGIPRNDNQFSANTNTFSELGLTFATTLIEGDATKLLFGLTAKALLGYNAQHFINRGLDYRIATEEDDPNSVFFEVDRLDATLGYTTFLQNRRLRLRTLLSPSAPGRGVGFDLGLTFVRQYDADSPALRLGVALTDVGGLTYRGEEYDYAGVAQQPVRFTNDDFNDVNGTRAIAQVIQQRLNDGRSPVRRQFRAGLPTSLNLMADYELASGVALNVTYLQDVRPVGATTLHQPTLLAVTPRIESGLIGLVLPITYLNRGLSAGLAVRVGPARLGTDNLLGLFGTARNGIRPRGLDIYAGLSFGLGRVEE